MASQKVNLVIQAQDKASGKINRVNKSVTSMGTASKKTGASLSAMGGKVMGAVAALAGLVAGMKKVVGLAMEQEKAEVRLAGVVKATGSAAGYTSQQLYDMAAAFQKTTSMGDEMVMGGQAILLTFKNIRGEAFERTMKSALDMAAVMGTDVKAAALQLGKALNDPKTGLTMLTRVGIVFTDEQKKVILALQETGDVAGAQAVILAEIESQMGGVAEALGETFSGSIAKAGAAMGDLGEQIGFYLAPALRILADGIVVVAEKTQAEIKALSGLRDTIQASVQAEIALDKAVRDGTISRARANELINKATWTSYTFRDALDEANVSLREAGTQWAKIPTVAEEADRAMLGSIDAHKGLATAAKEVEEAIANVGLELKNRLSVAMGKTSQEIVDMQTEAAALAADLKIVWDEAKAAEWVALSMEIDQVTQAFKDAAKANKEWLATIDTQTESADRAKRQMAELYDVVVEHEEATATSTDTTEQWSKIQDLAKLAAGDTTQAILDQEEEVARLTAEIDANKNASDDLVRQYLDAIKHLGVLTDEFVANSGSVRDNTAALSENAAKTERATQIKDEYAVVSGRATAETIALSHRIREATAAFEEEGEASGFTARQIAFMTWELDSMNSTLRTSRANMGAAAMATYAWRDSLNAAELQAYNTAAAAAAAAAAASSGTYGGSYGGAGGGGLPPIDQMREELAKADLGGEGWRGSGWMGKTPEDVFAEWMRLTGRSDSFDPGAYSEHTGDEDVQMPDTSLDQKKQDLMADLSTSDESDNDTLKDWMVPHLKDLGVDDDYLESHGWDIPADQRNKLAQHGWRGIVPSGYPNDSYTIGATSGEYVSVTPQHMMRGRGGGMSINTINVYGVQTESQLYGAVVKAAKQRGREFAKVM